MIPDRHRQATGVDAALAATHAGTFFQRAESGELRREELGRYFAGEREFVFTVIRMTGYCTVAAPPAYQEGFRSFHRSLIEDQIPLLDALGRRCGALPPGPPDAQVLSAYLERVTREHSWWGTALCLNAAESLYRVFGAACAQVDPAGAHPLDPAFAEWMQPHVSPTVDANIDFLREAATVPGGEQSLSSAAAEIELGMLAAERDFHEAFLERRSDIGSPTTPSTDRSTPHGD